MRDQETTGELAKKRRAEDDRRLEDAKRRGLERRRRAERRLPLIDDSSVSFSQWARAMVVYLAKRRRAKVKALLQAINKK
jgi:hypothetical protein